MGKHPDLSRTAAALDAYDADPTEENARAVGAAFGLDTADRSDPDVCAALVRPGPRHPLGGDADLPFVRRMVRRWTKAQGSSKKKS